MSSGTTSAPHRAVERDQRHGGATFALGEEPPSEPLVVCQRPPVVAKAQFGDQRPVKTAEPAPLSPPWHCASGLGGASDGPSPRKQSCARRRPAEIGVIQMSPEHNCEVGWSQSEGSSGSLPRHDRVPREPIRGRPRRDDRSWLEGPADAIGKAITRRMAPASSCMTTAQPGRTSSPPRPARRLLAWHCDHAGSAGRVRALAVGSGRAGQASRTIAIEGWLSGKPVQKLVRQLVVGITDTRDRLEWGTSPGPGCQIEPFSGTSSHESREQ